MERAFDQQFLITQQADRIERALYRMNIPGRVDGGSIVKNHIRYLITPSLGLHTDVFLKHAGDLAEEIGVDDLRFTRERDGLAIHVPQGEGGGIRLLPLMDSFGELGSQVGVLGLSITGAPLLLDFTMKNTWHLHIHGSEGAGKTEYLRSILISIALNSPIDGVEFLGIDLGGRELGVLEAVPHTRRRLATSLPEARAMLEDLVRGFDRFRNERADRARYLFIDRVDELIAGGREMASLVQHLIREGDSIGMHLICVSRNEVFSTLEPDCVYKNVVLAGALSGRSRESSKHLGCFHLIADVVEEDVEAAWLSVHDLDEAISRLSPS